MARTDWQRANAFQRSTRLRRTRTRPPPTFLRVRRHGLMCPNVLGNTVPAVWFYSTFWRSAEQYKTAHCFSVSFPEALTENRFALFVSFKFSQSPVLRRKSGGRTSEGKNTVKSFVGVVKQRNLLRTGYYGYSTFRPHVTAHMAVVQLCRCAQSHRRGYGHFRAKPGTV